LDVLTRLRRGRELIDTLHQRARQTDRHAAQVAEDLRTLWPSSLLFVCCFDGDSGRRRSVLDREGRTPPDWDKAPEEELARVSVKRDSGTFQVKLSESLGLPELTVSILSHRGRRLGALALALPESVAPEIATVESILFEEYSRELSLALSLERQETEENALRQLQAEQMGLCGIGVVSGVISHELYNVLNNISLQVAVLTKQVHEPFHAGLAVIHEQATQAAEILRSLQQYRLHHQPRPYPVDLNRLLREEFEMASRPGDALKLELAVDLPPVLGTASELKILLYLLLSNANRLATGNSSIRTSHAAQRVHLRIAAQGRSLAPEYVQGLFEPLGQGQEPITRQELAGCQQIVRRLEGTVRAESLPQGGLAFIVELPEAGETVSS
jgi:signal transduction histidine kinase